MDDNALSYMDCVIYQLVKKYKISENSIVAGINNKFLRDSLLDAPIDKSDDDEYTD